MTNLVYFSPIFKKYKDNVINDLELKYINDLIDSCTTTDLFINTTWGEVDDTLIELIKRKPSRAVLYSGMDWENTYCRKKFHDFVKSNVKNLIYIGNSDGLGYFSFWLFFLEKNFLNYKIEQVELKDPEYIYMCLNRKRHEHRVKLVEKLKQENLLKYGAVSLSGEPEKNIADLKLNLDIKDSDGNFATNFKPGEIPNDICSIGHISNWNKAFINVVTETTTHSKTFISEKTWKPIIGLRPFLIVGDKKIYSYLKEYGIDTFDDIFGTGYKDPHVDNRIDWIVYNLKKYSNCDILNLYKHLYPRLIENKLQLRKIFKLNSLRYKKVKNFLNNE